jgi:acyl-CoA reductase-like NAD-dependent aldehyde dehydrogenase
MMSYGIYLGGRWLETNDRLQVTNPYNGEQVGETSIASKEEMDIAAERAQDAFEIMKRMSAGERSAILKSMADGIRDRFEEFVNVIALESAKAISAAKTEVLRAINTLELASEEARRIGGDVIPMDMLPAARYKFGISRRFPVGVILGITPFNYPLNLPCHKIGPALAMGNSIIIKPASATPLSMMLLAEIAEKTDLPKGAFIVLPCRGSDTEHLISSPYVKKISFTGSADTGWRIKEIAARKKVTLELGGNAALVIHSDSDIAEAAKKAITGGFVYNGQVCISVQRVLVHRPVYEKTLESMVKETKGLKAGNQTDER